ncbi:MAG: NAD(P)/FAD-dependent oxidoreductase [Thalassobaculum sp.]|uniref:NAD(P)/FAD-dependent oxidoreductase n=1 Tax=Thalassobaculum sp. TaxID=2022740 RepID=UPI0032EE2A59
MTGVGLAGERLAGDGLAALERQAAADLERIAYPRGAWVPARQDGDGRRVLDVLVVGGGQGGVAIAHGLLRARVDNFRIVDRAERGLEGPWLTYARMATLRSPKEVNGPDLDVPSLTFQAWFEAQHGAPAWAALNKIPKQDWAAYLLWLRRVLGIPVENRVELRRVEPDGEHLRATLVHLDDGRTETVAARKLVLATGIEASGRWWTPPAVEALDRRFWAHTGDSIDFAALAGRRVAVLGAGASAFDNAATALEAGAAEVTVYCRRPDLQRVQPFKWLSFPGFLGHFAELDDAWRWRFMNHLLTLREAFPRETWERAARHPGFRLETGAEWQRCEAVGGAVRLHTPRGLFEADFLIVGTGFDVDLGVRPEMAGVAGHVALWGDRFEPPAEERNPRLARYPYLGPGYELLEKVPGAAPWLRHIRLFTYATTVSFGPSGASINAMKFAAPRLVSAIVSDLFREDVAAHWDSLRAYDLPEFLLTGETGEAAPVKPVVERQADGRFR